MAGPNEKAVDRQDHQINQPETAKAPLPRTSRPQYFKRHEEDRDKHDLQQFIQRDGPAVDNIQSMAVASTP
jgi:hypothetical protein